MAKKGNKYYHYYQPNKKDLKDRFGDCTIRALCKALNKEWVEVFDMLVLYERKFQCPFPGFTLDMYKEFYDMAGFKYQGISNVKGTKRPTVKEFAKTHPTGTYVLSVAHHHVCVTDGQYYDTLDCGHKSLYGYFEKTLPTKARTETRETNIRYAINFDATTTNGEVVQNITFIAGPFFLSETTPAISGASLALQRFCVEYARLIGLRCSYAVIKSIQET